MNYTITPNNGYQILDVLVDGVSDPGAIQAGSYTFTNVTANRTIAATFVPASVHDHVECGRQRHASRRWARRPCRAGGSQTFTITPNAGYHILDVLVDGASNPAAVAAGALHLQQRDCEPHDQRDVRGGSHSITVTAPTGASSQAQGSALPVTWTTNVTGGHRPVQHLGGQPGGGWFQGKIVAANGSAGYADSVTLNVPADTGYQIYVYYRATTGDPWGIYGLAPGTVDVTAPRVISAISVTAPTGASSQAQGDPGPLRGRHFNRFFYVLLNNGKYRERSVSNVMREIDACHKAIRSKEHTILG